ncbi:MAG: hypothetical protein EBU90_07505 [Proteobacteria bacterium]|nr:hypothetical protein [Pseudomonadota bacterium]NBP13450.1 hypothetical protein [bacterium]
MTKYLIALFATVGLVTAAHAADAKKEEPKKDAPKAEAKKEEPVKPKVKPVGKDGKPVEEKKEAAPAAKAEPAKK